MHILHNAKHPFRLKVPESSCISKCFDDQFCLSVTYVPEDSTCTFHDGATEVRPVKKSTQNNPRVIIFPSRINNLKEDLEVSRLEVGDNARDGSKSVKHKDECRDACLKDSACDIFSFALTVKVSKLETL